MKRFVKPTFAVAALTAALISLPPCPAFADAAHAIVKNSHSNSKEQPAARTGDGVHYCFAPDGTLIYTAVLQEPADAETLPPAAKNYLRQVRQHFYAAKNEADNERLLFFPVLNAAFAETAPYNDGFQKNKLPQGGAAQSGEYLAFTTEKKETPGTFSLVTTKTTNLAGRPRTQEIFAATFHRDGRRLTLNEILNRPDSADAVAQKALAILSAPPYKNQLAANLTQRVYDYCVNPLGDGWYADGGSIVVLYPPQTVLRTNAATIAIPLAQLLKH